MNLLLPPLAELLHLGLMLLAAPLVGGAMAWLDARFAGRRGPPIPQPWTDLVRLARKTTVIPESASRVAMLAPAVSLGVTLAAAALVPSFTVGTMLAPCADGLVVAGLLSLARVVTLAGALDTGAAASGLDAQHASATAVLAEPALLLLLFSLGLLAGSCNLDLIIGQQREALLRPAAGPVFALAALLALVFADVAAPAPALARDYSGIDLAMARATVWLRHLVWIDLIGDLFLAAGIAGPEGNPLDWAIGLAGWAVRLAAAVLCLAAAQAVFGRVPRRTQASLAALAALLALLAVVVVLADAGTA